MKWWQRALGVVGGILGGIIGAGVGAAIGIVGGMMTGGLGAIPGALYAAVGLFTGLSYGIRSGYENGSFIDGLWGGFSRGVAGPVVILARRGGGGFFDVQPAVRQQPVLAEPLVNAGNRSDNPSATQTIGAGSTATMAHSGISVSSNAPTPPEAPSERKLSDDARKPPAQQPPPLPESPNRDNRAQRGPYSKF